MSSAVKGGDKAETYLRQLAEKIGGPHTVSIGFLENATYPDGKSVAMVAAINEFGGTINVPPHQQTIYKMINKAGDGYLRKGHFVKASKSNFAQTVSVPGHTITIPPRPFFRNMITEKKGEWPGSAANLLVKYKMDISRALEALGEGIAGQLRESIQKTNSPPNAPSTVRRKGFNDPLIHSGHMYNSVDYIVKEGSL